MQIDSVAVRLRWRSSLEAPDLGIRLCQANARSVYGCHALALAPILALAWLSASWSPVLPFVVLWWAKPWLDRSILFALSRAAFGTPTRVRDLWAARGTVWFGQWWRTWTLRRLTASRATTQPILQLEQLRGAALRRRLQQLRHGNLAAARLLTSTFSVAELAVYAGMLSLWLWFSPQDTGTDWLFKSSGDSAGVQWFTTLPYVVAVAIVEPFYVAAGFGMYLNRRVELEAWDVEQELRHALV